MPSSVLYENLPPPTSLVPSKGYSSTTTSSAYISYEVEGRAVTGRFYVDYEDSTKVYISRPTTIIEANQWAFPVSLVKRKQVGCLCCAAGNVEFVAKLPRTGYCVTNLDTIPLVVNIQNNSTRVIEMRATIFQKVLMISQDNNSNDCCKTVAEVCSEPVQPGDSYEWCPNNWHIPTLLPTIVGSRILRLDYVLVVSAVIPNALNLICSIPLFMGNLPYANSQPVLVGRASVPNAVVSRVQDIALANIYHGDIYGDTSERDTLI